MCADVCGVYGLKYESLLIFICCCACYFQSGKYACVGLYFYMSNLSYRFVLEPISAYFCVRHVIVKGRMNVRLTVFKQNFVVGASSNILYWKFQSICNSLFTGLMKLHFRIESLQCVQNENYDNEHYSGRCKCLIVETVYFNN